MKYVYNESRVKTMMRDEGIAKLDAIHRDVMEHSGMAGRVEVYDEKGRQVMTVQIDPKFPRPQEVTNG